MVFRAAPERRWNCHNRIVFCTRERPRGGAALPLAAAGRVLTVYRNSLMRMADPSLFSWLFFWLIAAGGGGPSGAATP
jgi:hypothetical protein